MNTDRKSLIDGHKSPSPEREGLFSELYVRKMVDVALAQKFNKLNALDDLVTKVSLVGIMDKLHKNKNILFIWTL